MATFVSARLLSGFLQSLAVQRIDVDALIGDLPIEWSHGARRTTLVDWDDVAEIGARLERRLGGAEALEELGAAIVASRPMPAIRRLAGWGASPTTLYRTGLRWLELHMPRDLTTGMSTEDDGRLEIQIVMPGSPRSCRPFFHMLAGAARALPALVELPDAVVEGRIGAHSATFVITPPASGTRARRMLRGLRTLLGSNDALGDLEEERHLLRRHVDQLERALFESTTREAELRALAESGDELLLEVDADGCILVASEAARNVTGYEPGQIIGSHLSLWFHRDDDARVRALLARACADEDDTLERGVRARHGSGRWMRTQVEVRRVVQTESASSVIVSIRESEAGFVDDPVHADRARLAARLRRLERRHRDQREIQPQLLDAERAANARENADVIEATLAGPIRVLAERLDAAAHLPQAAGAELPYLAELAQRIDAGLERTLATLRRSKSAGAPIAVSVVAAALRNAFEQRGRGRGVRVVVECDGSAPIEADPGLLSAAFEHVADHLARDATAGGRAEARLTPTRGGNTLRVAIEWASAQSHGRPSATLSADLELARGLLRAMGGDVLCRASRGRGTRLELELAIAAPGDSDPSASRSRAAAAAPRA